MSDVRIFRPAKTAMQSGRARTVAWVMEFTPRAAKRRDALMGWPGKGDTREQVRLEFDTREEAVAYAKRHHLSYELETARERRIRPKSYAENFRYGRSSPWTH